MAVFGENGGLNVKFWVRDPKGTSLRETASFDVYAPKSLCGLKAVGDWKNRPPPKKNEKIAETKGCAKSDMRRNETPYLICIKFCLVVGIPDLITCTNFGYIRFRGYLGGGGSNFPIAYRLSSSPLQHPRTTVRVCDT